MTCAAPARPGSGWRRPIRGRRPTCSASSGWPTPGQTGPRSPPGSAISRPNGSAPNSCTRASRSAAWPLCGPAWRTCSSGSPGRDSMSTADARVRPPAAGAAGRPAPARAWLRLLGSELGLVFRRRRNLALLAVVAVIPVVIGIALRLAAPPASGGNGEGPPFLDQVAGNGVFLTFLALTILLTLVLPLVVSVVA